MINRTVGTAGDHSTWAAAMSWLNSQFPLSDDITFTQISDTTETTAGTVAGSSDFNGKTVLFTSDTPHGGVPGVGWATNISTSFAPINFGSGVGVSNGTLEIKDLRIVITSSYNQILVASAKDDMTIRLHNVLAYGPTTLQGATSGGFLVEARDSSSVVEVWNCMVDIAGAASNTAYAWWFNSTDASATFKVENCTTRLSESTVSDARTYYVGTGTGSIIFRSNWGTYTAGTGQAYSGSLTNAEGYGNAANDATANAFGTTGTYFNNLSGQYMTDDYTTYPYHFWSPFKRETVYDGGVTPSISPNSTDIYGEARPSSGRVAIGALNDGRARNFNVPGDYATWYAAEIAMPTIGVSGDWTYTQTASFDETQDVNFNEELNGYTLTLTSNSKPNGDPNAGHVTTMSGNYRGIQLMYSAPSRKYGGTYVVDGLVLKRPSTRVRGDLVYSQPVRYTECRVINTILDYRDVGQMFYDGLVIICSSSKGTTGLLYNTLILDHYPQTGYLTMELSAGGSGGHIVAENCVSIAKSGSTTGYGIGVVSGSWATIRNCVSLNSSQGGFSFPSRCIGISNASDDGTAADANWAQGIGNLANITPGNEFQSTSYDSGSLFMAPKMISQVATGGEDPKLIQNTEDVTGEARPHFVGDGYATSIGFKEAASIPIFITPLSTQTVDEGNQATFSAVVQGAGTLVWKKNGTIIEQIVPAVGAVQGS